MKRSLGWLVAAFVAWCPLQAKAQSATTYQLTDSASSVHQVHGFTCLTTLLCLAQVPIDVTGTAFGTAANPFYVGGFDSGPVNASCSGSPCVANSSHAAGTSIGGLFTMPLARINGGSGLLSWIQIIFPGAGKGVYVLRGWTKSPSSTCTDNTAFANNAADDPYVIPGLPITIGASAPASTIGDSRTYAQNGFAPPLHYKNNDTSASQNLYFCLVTVAVDTADENTTPVMIGAGPQN